MKWPEIYAEIKQFISKRHNAVTTICAPEHGALISSLTRIDTQLYASQNSATELN